MTLLTEKEAAEKWCPMFRASVSVGPSDGVEVYTNRDNIHVDGVHNCIGSRCMAWRIAVPDSDPMDRNGEIYFAKPARGYCGAFGKVEP